MSSTKRSYNETIFSNSSISTTLNDTNDYVVLEEQQEVEQDMDIEEQIQQVEEENFVSRRKRANTDKDDLFKSNTNDHSFQSSTPISSTRDTLNYPSSSNTFSNTPNSIANSKKTVSYTTTSLLNNYISPKDSFNNNTHDNNSTLKVSEDTKALSPIDLLMSSPPISTSTPKTSQTKNTSNSSLTLTTQNSDTWDFNYTDSSPYNTASNSCDYSSNDNYFLNAANIIHTNLNINSSHGPFSPIYSQIYDSEGIVFATESFNYLVQLYEFCDNNSTNLQSKITSILRDLVLLINNQLDGFDIPFIEHHKWNGSHFYGPVDVEFLLDQLDDGLGISSAKYVWYDYSNIMRTRGSVLQCGCRRTRRRTFRIDENQSSSSSSASSSTSITSGLHRSANNTNDLQDNDLRHAVLNRDAEREAQIFLELLAEEEENGEDNDIEQEEESDSFTEISKESDDDDDFLIQGLASTSIRQRTDTFGNPINQTRTTSTRHISRPSADNDGNETDDSFDDYLAESGNLTESTYEEIDFSDVESITTDSTNEDGWHNVSRDN